MSEVVMSIGETPIVIIQSMHYFVMPPKSHIDALSLKVTQESNTDWVVPLFARLVQ